MKSQQRDLKESIKEREDRIRWLMNLLAIGGSIKLDRGLSPFSYKKPRSRDDWVDAVDYFVASQR